MAELLTRIWKAGTFPSLDKHLISGGKIKAKAFFLQKNAGATFCNKFLFNKNT